MKQMPDLNVAGSFDLQRLSMTAASEQRARAYDHLRKEKAICTPVLSPKTIVSNLDPIETMADLFQLVQSQRRVLQMRTLTQGLQMNADATAGARRRQRRDTLAQSVNIKGSDYKFRTASLAIPAVSHGGSTTDEPSTMSEFRVGYGTTELPAVRRKPQVIRQPFPKVVKARKSVNFDEKSMTRESVL